MKLFSRRRAVLLAFAAPSIPVMSGCRAALPVWSSSDTSQQAFSLLLESASAHGLAAFRPIVDLNVSYAGHWHRLAGLLQPVLVDSGFRGVSEERILLHDGIIAQSHLGRRGHKQVVRINAGIDGGSIRVWFNGVVAEDRDRNDAAALVAEAYRLFLLGPLLLAVNENPRRDIQGAMAGTVNLRQDGKVHFCDVLNFRLRPGFGNSESDQVALFVDRQTRVMRRVRMTVNGLESTRGALVDIDTWQHCSLHGVIWPTAFQEQLLRPAPLDVHEWRLTGLDINRGELPAELVGPGFTGKALVPATPLSACGLS